MGLRGPQKPKTSFLERFRSNIRPNIMICESCISWFTAGYSTGNASKKLFSDSVDLGDPFCTFERINNSFCDHFQPNWKFMIFHFFKIPKKYRICDDLRAGQQNRRYRPRVVPMGPQCRERVFSTPWTRARAPLVIWGPSYALSRHLLEINEKITFSSTTMWRCVAKRNICC